MTHSNGSGGLGEFLAKLGVLRSPQQNEGDGEVAYLAELAGVPYRFSGELAVGPIFLNRNIREVPEFVIEFESLINKVSDDIGALAKKHFGENNALTPEDLLEILPHATAALHKARGVEPPAEQADDDLNESMDNDSEQVHPESGNANGEFGTGSPG